VQNYSCVGNFHTFTVLRVANNTLDKSCFIFYKDSSNNYELFLFMFKKLKYI